MDTMIPSQPTSADSKPITFSSLLSDTFLAERLESLGIIAPTPIQISTIPPAIAGHDMLMQAQTGSGKTFAYALPLLQLARNSPSKKKVCGLIMTPTRELATQVAAAIRSVAPDLTPACIIGGASFHSQRRGLREDARIIVGTPGRLLDLIMQREISLRECRYFVLDEADEMLSLGFLQDVRAILSRLPSRRQGLFVSATISPRVETLADDFLKKPMVISTHPSDMTAAEIRHIYFPVDGGVAAKARSLSSVLEAESPDTAIVFCNTKSDTELVEVILRRRGVKASRLNSDLSQKEREDILERLRSRELPVLIATDIAARGIDIVALDLVVNYSVSSQPEMYVHRSGRTGRAGRPGLAVSLVGPEDLLAFANVKRTLAIEFEEFVPMEKRKVA